MIFDLEEKLKALRLDVISKLLGRTRSEPLRLDLQTHFSGTNKTVTAALVDPVGDVRFDNPPVYSPRQIAAFQLSTLPGDGDVAVSHAVYIDTFHRHRGLGTLLHGERLEAATKAGASAMLCTVSSANEAERKILFGHGWKQVFEYQPRHQRSVENGYHVEVWMKEL